MRQLGRLSPQAERFARRPASFPLQIVFNEMNRNAGRQEGLSALDLGCGYGRDTLKLVLQGHQTIGIDRSAEALEVARKRHSETAFKLSKVTFLETDIRELPPFSKQFSLVHTANTLQYMPKADQYEVISDMQQHTGYLGRCVISTARVYDKLDNRQKARAFEPEELRELFSSDDWQIRTVYDMVPFGDTEPIVNLIAHRIS